MIYLEPFNGHKVHFRQCTWGHPHLHLLLLIVLLLRLAV